MTEKNYVNDFLCFTLGKIFANESPSLYLASKTYYNLLKQLSENREIKKDSFE